MHEELDRRRIPSVQSLMRDAFARAADLNVNEAALRSIVRNEVDRVRDGHAPLADLLAAVNRALEHRVTQRPRGVINATGVMLHTNLGRSPLSSETVAAMTLVTGYSNLELDLETGRRSSRGASVVSQLIELTGAEDALIANNNAAALYLITSVFAQNREVVLSRGEMVEIGAGARVADIVRAAGARLVEVGATNRTHLTDYQAAIGPDTAFILKVHAANYELVGYTSSVDVKDLAQLDVPVVWDIGSGLLKRNIRLPAEPDFATALLDGASLVTGSGDKLLGSMQAGIVLGRRSLVAQLRKHPLMRALRLDKLRIAALDATLRSGQTELDRMLATNPARLRERVEQFELRLRASGLSARLVSTQATIGGGGAPGWSTPSWGIAVSPQVIDRLRLPHAPHMPVIGIRNDEDGILDFFTVSEAEEPSMLLALIDALSTK